MKRNIFNYRDTVGSFKANVPLYVRWTRKVTRFDGSEEEASFANVVIADGLNAIASRIVSDTTSPFGFLSVGTVSAAHSLGSDNIGEVSRKVAATLTSSNEVTIFASTWAGDADSLTGVVLESAAPCNHVDSGEGIYLAMSNSVGGVTLADSDFLFIKYEIQVGSHNL